MPCLSERSSWGAGSCRSHWLELREGSDGPCRGDPVWWAPSKFCGHCVSHTIIRSQQKLVSALQECCLCRAKNDLLPALYKLWKIQLYLEIPQLFCGQNIYSFQIWVATPNSGPVSALFINASFIPPAPCEHLDVQEMKDLIYQSPSYPSVQRAAFHLILSWIP